MVFEELSAVESEAEVLVRVVGGGYGAG